MAKAHSALVIPSDEIPQLQKSLTIIDHPHLPVELQQMLMSYWLLWRPTPNKPVPDTTKLLKKPVNAAWQQPGQCLTYKDACKIHKKSRQPTGLGFIYNEEHPFVCIDIDDATEENNELVQLLNSYTEWSPSDKGLHVIVQCESLVDKLELIEIMGNGKRNLKSKRDLFISSGYVTITGRQLPITPAQVRTVPIDELTKILSKYFLTPVIPLPAKQQKDSEQAAMLQEFADNRPTKTTPKSKKETTSKASLNSAQVKQLLLQLPVQCLEGDVFERLYNDELAVIDYGCDEEAREPWLIVGQAIHHNFGGKLEGYYLWDAWSQKGNKYDSDACSATWESFKNPQQSKPVTIAALIKLANAQKPQFPDRTAKGQLKGTLANFHEYIDFYKFQIYHNEITRECHADAPIEILKRWRADTLSPGQKLSLTEIAEYICSDFITFGFAPTSYNNVKVKRYLTAIGKAKSVNPIRDYFIGCGEKWDGQDRINQLLQTIEVSPFDEQYSKAYGMFLRKWLIQVAAAACHAASHPVRLNRVLIFSGAQNIGKTRWVESLFPKQLRSYCAADKEIRISNFRTDNVKQTMELSNTLICNINEIDRLFRASTFPDFKAFLDQTADRIVLPYGDSPTEVTRRTVFIGSTNQLTFLKDTTGNRRFEVIHAQKLNFRHSIDIDQLWGQIFNLFTGGERWWLEETVAAELVVMRMRDTINSRSMYIGSDAIVESLDELFDVDATIENNDWQRLTFKEIRISLGLTHLTTNSKAFNQAKRAIMLWSKQVSGLDPLLGKGSRPVDYYYMPQIREVALNPPDLAENDIDPFDKETQINAIEEQMKMLMQNLNNLKED